MYRYVHINLLLITGWIVCSVFFSPTIASAFQVTLAWDAADEPDSAGFRVFLREENQNYDYSRPAWEGPSTTCTISGLKDNVAYCFVVRAYDNSGNESSNSNEVFYYPLTMDTDNDGMPDAWEEQHGLDPNKNDAKDDPDGDGIDNISEYQADSDPTLPEVNRPPEQPLLALPVNGELNVALVPVLQTEDFSDPDTDDVHSRTRWQIAREQDEFVVFDVTSDTALTSIRIPASILQEDTAYLWRATFFDKYGAASEWSETSRFDTALIRNDLNFDGIPDDQEVDNAADIDHDGNPDLIQLDIKSLYTEVGNGLMAVSFKDNANVASIETLESVDPGTISDPYNKPADMPLGLINFKLTVQNPGDVAIITVHFSIAAPENARWYKYDSVGGWQDYSTHAEFGIDRKSVTLELKDGGFGDADGIENGVIVDPSGFGSTLSGNEPGGGESGSGGACFISTAGIGANLQTLIRKMSCCLKNLSFSPIQ